jgi:membrane protease YdiL (CAAX protease family)
MFPETKLDLRRSYSRVSMVMLCYTLVMHLLAEGCVALPYLLHQSWITEAEWYLEMVNCVVVYPTGLLVLGLLLKNEPTPRLAKAPAPSPGPMIQTVVVGVGVLYAASTITALLLQHTNTKDFANEAIGDQPLPVAILFTVILAPVFEEILFRHLVLDRLLYLGDWSALLISSLFFGLFHTNLYQFLYAWMVGLVLGYIHIMTGRMIYNIGLHMFINLFCGVLVGYLPDSEPVNRFASLLILACVIYAADYLVKEKPWRELYPGPMTWFSARDKWEACFTAPAFWACVILHLGLSVFFITL